MNAQGEENLRKRHRDVWLGHLVVGVAFLGVGNWVSLPTWLVAALAITVMLVYGWSVRGYNVPADAKGEGIYYLGLLFTFFALVAALVTLDWDSASDASSGAVIRNFGIALVTTIVGLIGRVWFAMSQTSPGDDAREAHAALEDAVRKMKSSLGEAQNQFDLMAKGFRGSAKQIATLATSNVEGIDALAKSAKEGSGAVNSLRGDVGALADSIKTATDELAGFGKAAEEAGGTIDEVLQGTGEGLRAVVQKIDRGTDTALSNLKEASGAQTDAMEDLRRAAREGTASVGGFAESLGRAREDAERINLELNAGAGAAASAVKRLTREAGAQANAASEMGESAGVFSKEMTQLARLFEGMRPDVDKLAEKARQVDSAFGAMGKASRAAGGTFQAMADLGGRGDANEVSVLRGIERALTALGNAVRGARDAFANVGVAPANLEQDLGEAGANAKKMGERFEGFDHKAVSGLETELEDLSKKMKWLGARLESLSRRSLWQRFVGLFSRG